MPAAPSGASSRKPQEPGASWEVGKAVTEKSPSFRVVRRARGSSLGPMPSSRASSSRQTRSPASTGQSVRLRRTGRPEMWSVWVWVMRTAVKSRGVRPSSPSAPVIRRQEIPASTSRCVLPRQSSRALPEEPLARVCSVVKGHPSQCLTALKNVRREAAGTAGLQRGRLLGGLSPRWRSGPHPARPHTGCPRLEPGAWRRCPHSPARCIVPG